jgi:hypothetical protein
LIISAIVIEILINYPKTQINEPFGFFAGFLSGAGIGMPLKMFFGKKKKD